MGNSLCSHYQEDQSLEANFNSPSKQQNYQLNQNNHYPKELAQTLQSLQTQEDFCNLPQNPDLTKIITHKNEFLQDLYDPAYLKELACQQNAPRLTLRIKGQHSQCKSQTLEMTVQGMVNGNRNKQDGICYIGSKKKSKPDSSTGDRAILNDFVVKRVNLKDDNAVNMDQEQYRGRQMSIRYCLASKAYVIRDLGLGLGTFIKIGVSKPFILSSATCKNNSSLIHIGKTYLLFQTYRQQELKQPFGITNFNSQVQKQPCLRVKVFGETSSHGQTFEFSPSDNLETNKVQKWIIGRSEDKCDFQVDDAILSKKHCTVAYDHLSQNWLLTDGSELNASMNGTWALCAKEAPIGDRETYMVADVLFQAFIV